MKIKVLSVILAAMAAVLSATAGFAASLPEGSFKGSTPFIKSPDVMALLLKKDPANEGAFYAILADYDRITGRFGPDRLAITKWVRRMYAYRVEQTTERNFAMKPLRVSAGGDIEIDGSASPDILSLAKPGTMDGAILTRYNRNSVVVAETIKFNGKLGSTWEKFVPGKFFGSTDSTGGDYFKKDVNLVLSQDKVADFTQKDVTGQFDVAEKAPGLFTFKTKSPDNKGIEKIEARIGVFVDIVNWKPIFTTDELLLINPADPKDVGFYYERH